MPDWQPCPRLNAPPLPDGEVIIQAPADAPRPLPINPVLKLLPLFTIVAVIGMVVLYVTSGSAARSPASLMFPAMMVLSTLGYLAHGRTVNRTADIDETRKDYLRYLDRLRADATKSARQQRASLMWQHPDPAALWTLAGTRRMWERHADDSDFAHVRVGLGAQRSAVKLTSPDLAPTDQLEPVSANALRNFVRTHALARDMPVALAVCGFRVIAVDGDETAGRQLLRAMLCQLAVLHSPQHIAVAAVVDGCAGEDWEWLKWLPHHQHPTVFDESGPVRMRYRTAGAFAAELGKTSSSRRMVVVVDGVDVGSITALLGADVTALVVGNATDAVPRRDLLQLSIIGKSLAVTGDDVEVFARPDALTTAQADVCARRLARHGPAVGHTTSATAGDWTALLNIDDAAVIEPLQLWRNRLPDNRLRVPIGLSPDGAPVYLDVKEAAENGMGPHGLCVGATGSGKSEFLRTLTLGMVTTHSPEELNLVLVDFKGGAAFVGFERAQHVAALITNLSGDAHLVARMRDALAGEMHRRQELLRASGNFASVADYERARRAGARLRPLPTLMIVVDEFSELLSQHPDFADMFVAIGRQGRSLRMHLLLASQRLDEGRLRGLESHLSYRICLKTFSANESRAVLGVPDAFHLPATPGAAFLRTASGDLVAFRTAYVSGEYVPPARPPAATPRRRAVRLFTADPVGEPTACSSGSAVIGVTTGQTVLEIVLSKIAGRGSAAHPVWLPPLSQSPTLDTLMTGGSSSGGLRVPIGVVDKPFEQRRDPFVVDVSGSAGNVAIVGATQSGKSNALRTLITAVAQTHSPEQVQFYCLDFGGGGLAATAQLPHVGSVASRADTDLVRRTVAELTAILRSREITFRRLGIDSAADFRRRRDAGDGAFPAERFGDVFLVIDGWASLRDEFDELEAAITTLTARGLSYGLHVVLTASRWGEIRPGLKDQLGTRIELRLGDAGDSELNRRAAQQVPHGHPGRGITADGQQMLIALPRFDGICSAAGLSAAIADAAVRIRSRFGDRKAPPVRLLPDRVDHTALTEDPGRHGLTLGVDEDELALVSADFDEHQHLLILGDAQCGKTAALRLISTQIMRRHSAEEARITVVDYRRTLLGVVDGDHLAGYLVSDAMLAAALPAFVGRLRARMPGPEIDHHQLRTRSWWSGPEEYLIVDDYDLLTVGVANPLAVLVELLPHAKDLGLHVIIARRSGGAGRALFEAVLARLREVGCMGLMMSANADEGVLLGTSRPSPLPPGRARFITRDGERTIQLAWVPPCPA